MMHASLRAVKSLANQIDLEQQALQDVLDDGTLYSQVPQIIVEALFSSQELTFTEKVVMGAVSFTLFMYMVKSRMCPRSWERDFTVEQKRLTEVLLEKRRQAEIKAKLEGDSAVPDSEKSLQDGSEQATSAAKMPSLRSEFAQLAKIWTVKKKDPNRSTHLSQINRGVNILADSKIKEDVALMEQLRKCGVTLSQQDGGKHKDDDMMDSSENAED